MMADRGIRRARRQPKRPNKPTIRNSAVVTNIPQPRRPAVVVRSHAQAQASAPALVVIRSVHSQMLPDPARRFFAFANSGSAVPPGI